jgi:hypothetical protein
MTREERMEDSWKMFNLLASVNRDSHFDKRDDTVFATANGRTMQLQPEGGFTPISVHMTMFT